MGEHTNIAYCDSTLNLMMGCDGCELHNPKDQEASTCYAAALCNRHAGQPGWPVSFDTPALFPERLKAALRWPDLTGTERPEKPWLNGYPRIIFVNDLGDTWTESLPVDWIAPYLPRMADSPHIWLFCTKRPRRARECFEKHPAPWNLWLLTTITGPETLGRAGELLTVPGVSVRGLSLEPLLGPVIIPNVYLSLLDWGEGKKQWPDGAGVLNWIIGGFESGPKARPGHAQWARDLRDSAVAAGTPFFWKQWGEWLPAGQDGAVTEQGQALNCSDQPVRVGKRAAGRLLDGHEWLQMPEVQRG